MEAADDSHVALIFISRREAVTHLPAFILLFLLPVCEDLEQIILMTNAKCCHVNVFKWQK